MTTILDDKLNKYKEYQQEYQNILTQKQQVLSQYNENTLVKGELDLLSEENKVYKLVGPILMRVELDESKENVSKRLEFIESELKRMDTNIDSKLKEINSLGDEIAKQQMEMQASASQADKEAAGL